MLDYLLPEPFTANAFFKNIELTVVRYMLEGFNIIHLLPGEFLYNVKTPANAGRLTLTQFI